MKRDYSKLADELNNSERYASEIICEKIKETIVKDDIDDAVDNIWEIIIEIKHKF